MKSACFNPRLNAFKRNPGTIRYNRSQKPYKTTTYYVGIVAKKRPTLSSWPQADGPRRHSDAIFLNHQPYPPIRLAERFRMRQYHRPDLLLGNWSLIPTLEEAAFVDFTGDLFRLHSMAGVSKDVYYGFFKFHFKCEFTENYPTSEIKVLITSASSPPLTLMELHGIK